MTRADEDPFIPATDKNGTPLGVCAPTKKQHLRDRAKADLVHVVLHQPSTGFGE